MESRQFRLANIGEFIMGAVFPRWCVSCNAEGRLLCDPCVRAFDDVVMTRTDDHLTLFAYGNPTVRNLIRAWKYDYDHTAFPMLMELAKRGTESIRTFIGSAITVPIPLSPLRERERGFNQAEIFARWAKKESTIKDLLLRKEGVGHQAERNEEERRKAMEKNPFHVRESRVPKEIVLVDDVWTTGSTMHAAARALRESGAEDIRFLTIAKG